MPFSSDMVKNSIRVVSFQSFCGGRILPGAAHKKKPGRTRSRLAVTPARQPGRFIWQLVGVLETYGSIFLTSTKV